MYRGSSKKGYYGSPARGRGRGRGRGCGKGKGKGKGGVVVRPKQWTRDTTAAAARADLPVAAKAAEIKKLCREARALVITGDAGCGKSTQVPQYIIDDGPTLSGRPACVLVTQPRRVAAVSVARRVAAERGEAVGATSVGYHVSGDVRVPSRRHEDEEEKARVVYMTTGVLLQLLIHEREAVLQTYTHIVVDEAHDRDVDLDLVLVSLRRVLIDGAREPLFFTRVPTIVVMSATVDTHRLSAFLCNAPHLHVGAQPHAVTVYDIQALHALHRDLGLEPLPRWTEKPQLAATKNARLDPSALRCCCDLLLQLDADPSYGGRLVHGPDAEDDMMDEGDVLVFLPGVAEIDELFALLERAHLDSRYDVVPLHGGLDDEAQRAAVGDDHHQSGRRRVVLSTNVAESSVTVSGVRFVVDLGLEKLPVYDARTRTQALLTRHCSRASARQRAGRCGRVAAGACLRLYSEHVLEVAMPEYIAPEIVRAPLTNVALKALMLDPRDPAQLISEALDRPEGQAVLDALEDLTAIGAVAKQHQAPPITMVGQLALIPPPPLYHITALGRVVSRLEIDANVGRLVIFGAALGCLDDAATVAAHVSLREVFLQPFEQQQQQQQQQTAASRGGGGFLTLDQAKREAAHFAARRDHTERAQYSDALAVVSVFDEWRKRRDRWGRDAAGDYARSQHCSYKRLVELENLRSRLLDRYKMCIASSCSSSSSSSSSQTTTLGGGVTTKKNTTKGLAAKRNGLAQVLKSRPALATIVRKAALLAAFAPCVAMALAIKSHLETKTHVTFNVGAPPLASQDDDDAPDLSKQKNLDDLAAAAQIAFSSDLCHVRAAAIEDDRPQLEDVSSMAVDDANEDEDDVEAKDNPALESGRVIKEPTLGIDGLDDDDGGDALYGGVGYDEELYDPLTVAAAPMLAPKEEAMARPMVRLRLECGTVRDAIVAARMGGVRGSLVLGLPGKDDGKRQVTLTAPRLGAATLRFWRPALRSHVEPVWTSSNARFFVDPYESAPCARRYLVAPFVSALGASRTRQLAHSATLLPAEPVGVAELLLVATAREVRWLIRDDADGRPNVVGAELYGPKTKDELVVWFPTKVTAEDIGRLNAIREALSAACLPGDGRPGAALEPLVDLLDSPRDPIVDVDDPATTTLDAHLKATSKGPRRRALAACYEPDHLFAPLRQPSEHPSAFHPKRKRTPTHHYPPPMDGALLLDAAYDEPNAYDPTASSSISPPPPPPPPPPQMMMMMAMDASLKEEDDNLDEGPKYSKRSRLDEF